MKSFFDNKYIRSLRDSLKVSFLTNYVNLSDTEISNLLNGKIDYTCVKDFEDELSKEFGSGKIISFASGRMAFYAILKSLGIGKGDQVALTGFSCSVMSNAILKTGATPLYIDIDKETLGTSPDDLKNKITSSTKVVVAQHTFGLPCRIEEIKRICIEYNLFLIEDCALTLGSSYNGIKLGDWGDVTLFSTDHSKPLNSLIGGGAYTKNMDLFARIKKIQSESGNLSDKHIKSIIHKYVEESKRLEYNRYHLLWMQICNRLFNRYNMINKESPYLESECTSDTSRHGQYPYPAKMPKEVAYIALKSLKDYRANMVLRQEFSNKVQEIISEDEYIPKIMREVNVDIIPLRVPYILKRIPLKFYSFLNLSWIWFQKPIVATSDDLSSFGYKDGSCPNAEIIGKTIMNIPIYYDNKMQNKILKELKKIYN